MLKKLILTEEQKQPKVTNWSSTQRENPAPKAGLLLTYNKICVLDPKKIDVTLRLKNMELNKRNKDTRLKRPEALD